MRRRRSALVALGLLGGLASGCYDGVDPLDPALLAEIARDRGDAQGIAMSGLYTGAFDAIECGCDEFGQLAELSACGLVEQSKQFGIEGILTVEVIQADGSVRFRLAPVLDVLGEQLFNPTLYGPLESDGTLTSAGQVQFDALLVEGQIYGRLDGTLSGSGRDRALEATYRQRYVVQVLSEVDGDVGSEFDIFDGRPPQSTGVQCDEQIDMQLRWLGPPLEPGLEE